MMCIREGEIYINCTPSAPHHQQLGHRVRSLVCHSIALKAAETARREKEQSENETQKGVYCCDQLCEQHGQDTGGS